MNPSLFKFFFFFTNGKSSKFKSNVDHFLDLTWIFLLKTTFWITKKKKNYWCYEFGAIECQNHLKRIENASFKVSWRQILSSLMTLYIFVIIILIMWLCDLRAINKLSIYNIRTSWKPWIKSIYTCLINIENFKRCKRYLAREQIID